MRSVLAGVDRSPLIVGALCAIVEELYLKEALIIVLVLCTLTEVVAIVGHEFIRAVLLVDNVLQDSQSLAVLMALHQCTGIVSGSGSTGGTAFGPFSALVA